MPTDLTFPVSTLESILTAELAALNAITSLTPAPGVHRWRESAAVDKPTFILVHVTDNGEPEKAAELCELDFDITLALHSLVEEDKTMTRLDAMVKVIFNKIKSGFTLTNFSGCGYTPGPLWYKGCDFLASDSDSWRRADMHLNFKCTKIYNRGTTPPPVTP